MSSRREALNLGKKYYYTGKSCKNGHTSLRYSRGGTCVECAEMSRSKRTEKEHMARSALSYEHSRYPSLHRFLTYKFSNTYKGIKHRVKVRAMQNTIIVNDIFGLWYAQEGLCAISGIRMTFPVGEKRTNDMCQTSIDRICGDDGYVRGNMQLVCLAINRLKHCNSMQDTVRFLDKLKRD